MLNTVQSYTLYHAPVDQFSTVRNSAFSGSRLHDVGRLTNSIARHGLLSPLTVIRQAGRLVIIDGRKRLAAIRKLAFEGRLPLSLTRIPYRLAGEMSPQQKQPLASLRNMKTYAAIQANYEAGLSVSQIADKFDMSEQSIRDGLALKRLASPIRKAFFKRDIGLAQALAFATQPSQRDQLVCFSHLGVTADPEDILARLTNKDVRQDLIAA